MNKKKSSEIIGKIPELTEEEVKLAKEGKLNSKIAKKINHTQELTEEEVKLAKEGKLK